jgi:hypothetical protein
VVIDDAGNGRGQTPGGQPERGDPGMPRFKPTDATPGIPQPPSWEPGVVEVQFREDVRPEIQTRMAESAPPQISSPADADMMPLNRLQQHHQLREAATAWISPTRTTPLMAAPMSRTAVPSCTGRACWGSQEQRTSTWGWPGSPTGRPSGQSRRTADPEPPSRAIRG